MRLCLTPDPSPIPPHTRPGEGRALDCFRECYETSAMLKGLPPSPEARGVGMGEGLGGEAETPYSKKPPRFRGRAFLVARVKYYDSSGCC